MSGPTRGFVGRRRTPPGQQPARELPPGQYDVGADFPVLTAEVTPNLVPERWTMTVDGLVASPHTWTWHEMHDLPQSQYRGAIHCVTTWSKFGTTFGGVSVDRLLEVAQPQSEATHVLATSTTGYTTNMPVRTSSTARPGSSGRTKANRCPATMAARCGYWCRICTFGRARSG